MQLSRSIYFLLSLVMIVLSACDALPTDATIVVKADEIAVVYAQDTGALENTLYEGAYDIAPQQSVAFYPLFWQVYTFRDEFTLSDRALGDEAIEAYTIDEAKMRVSMTLVFRLNADEIDVIFDSWGNADYRVGYIRPTARRVIRDVIGLYTAQDLSELPSIDLQTQIENALRAELEANGFLLQRVDVEDVRITQS
jgi:regulator of protease activity HflC (stomatin/prohibitin superfamily)